MKRWVTFHKKHRTILNSDLIHLRREDGKSEKMTLARDYTAEVSVTLPARGRTWITVQTNQLRQCART